MGWCSLPHVSPLEAVQLANDTPYGLANAVRLLNAFPGTTRPRLSRRFAGLLSGPSSPSSRSFATQIWDRLGELLAGAPRVLFAPTCDFVAYFGEARVAPLAQVLFPSTPFGGRQAGCSASLATLAPLETVRAKPAALASSRAWQD